MYDLVTVVMFVETRDHHDGTSAYLFTFYSDKMYYFVIIYHSYVLYKKKDESPTSHLKNRTKTFLLP